jgi:hypothetical protein
MRLGSVWQPRDTKLVPACFIIIACSLGVSAQERIIDRTEFMNAVRGFCGLHKSYEGRAHRDLMTTDFSDSNTPSLDYRTLSLIEHDPAGSIRFLTEITRDGKTVTRETVGIEGARYFREGNGPWRLAPRRVPRAPLAPTRSAMPQPPKLTCGCRKAEYKVQAVRIEDQSLLMFTKTVKGNCIDRNDGSLVESETIKRYFLTPDLIPFWFEQWDIERNGQHLRTRRIIVRREIDNSIRIAVPSMIQP